jgi:hypothetical protein
MLTTMEGGCHCGRVLSPQPFDGKNWEAAFGQRVSGR